jgi:hypothetical protein
VTSNGTDHTGVSNTDWEQRCQLLIRTLNLYQEARARELWDLAENARAAAGGQLEALAEVDSDVRAALEEAELVLATHRTRPTVRVTQIVEVAISRTAYAHVSGDVGMRGGLSVEVLRPGSNE